VYEQPTLEELVAEAERKAKAAAAAAKKLNSTASTGANKAKDGDKPKGEFELCDLSTISTFVS
jgi:hypothetical protein